MTVTTKPAGIRSIAVENGIKKLEVHLHEGGYGPRITVSVRVLATSTPAKMEITMTDALALSDALQAMVSGFKSE